MAHHRLGHREQGRACFERSLRWIHDQKALSDQHAKELAAFRAEAEAVLADSDAVLPAQVFAGPK
jgi:hypothetical protein